MAPLAEAAAVDFTDRCRAAHCRGCGHAGLQPVVDFGAMPLSDAFVETGDTSDRRAPLALAVCGTCGLTQLLDTLPPETLFGPNYLYLSSVSQTLADAARANAAALTTRYGLKTGDLVIEVACNDGYLLRHFAAEGIRVLGIEPAPVPATAARRTGIEVRETFFSRPLARELAAARRPRLVIANNVVAHVPDPSDFVAGLAELVGADGAAVIEVHSLSELVRQLQFDTIYHEHASYFSATSIAALFRRHGLQLQDVESIPLQGGSLRLHFARTGAISPRVTAHFADEVRHGIAHGSALKSFADRVTRALGQLRQAIERLAADGASIAAYGAAAKGTMLLNHLGPAAKHVKYVVDRNPHKQGRLVPGVGIPIKPPTQLENDPPGAVLLLPWNLRDEILPLLMPLRRRGTKILVPLPEPELL